MLHPSYSDLMDVANSGVEEGEEPIVQSRYSIVMATAKRARQLVAGDTPLVEGMEGRKPLSIAVEELYKSKIRILGEDEELPEDEESENGAVDADLKEADAVLNESEETLENTDDITGM